MKPVSLNCGLISSEVTSKMIDVKDSQTLILLKSRGNFILYFTHCMVVIS